MSEYQCRKYIVRGRVQGVGFRYFTREQGRSLGLDGWVRNCPNGEVEVMACGQPARLSQFEETLRTGPSFAAVRQVRSEPATFDDGDVAAGFVIR